jgi:DUF4097 and DUF4098 domain-containing protein YvlB
MSNTSRSVTLGLIAAVSLALPASAAEKKEFRYTVTPGATISVINDYGPVRLRASNPNQVVVTAMPASKKVEADGAQNGNRIEIRTRFLQKAGESDGRVEYDLQVPADANVMVRTATGPVQVQGINGDVSIDSDTAKVDVHDSSGHVHVRTVGGPITLANLKDGFVEATSVGGQITLNDAAAKVLSVNTTGGPILYNGDFGGGGQYALSSHSGSIDVRLPGSASVDLTARTVTGTVENDFPLKAPAHPTMALDQGKSFAGTSNAGASAVRLRTFSGRIRVKKQ